MNREVCKRVPNLCWQSISSAIKSVYTTVMKRLWLWAIAVVLAATYTPPVFAEYTVVLKNGRRITAKSYREEGSMVKIPGLGGELGIAKDQIQTILKTGATDRQGLSISDLEASTRQASPSAKTPDPIPLGSPAETARAEETRTAGSAEEVKGYQKRLAEITEKLDAAKQEYFNATQGGSSAANVSKEGFNAWIADLGSRIRDSQKVTGGGGSSSTPPMPSSIVGYTPREKQLSDLRARIDSLQMERDKLIEEMNSKNVPAGGS